MSAAKAIYGKLTTTAAVSAMVGDRVYPARAVQFETLPLVAYDVTDSDYDQTYAGPSGLASHVVTIACVGATYDQAEAVGAAVIAAVNGQDGAWGGQTVQGCFVNSVGDAEETEVDQDRVVWRKDVEATVWIAS